MIEAITFDFWNTLFAAVRADGARRRQIKQTVKRAGHSELSDSRIQRAIDCAWQEWDRIWTQDYRTFGAEHWVSLVLADLGVSLTPTEQRALTQAMATSGMEANPSLIDGLDILLPRLAGRYRLGLICDTGLSPGWMLRQQIDRHGILGFFSHLTFSDELGVSKPHPEAFISTLACLGVAPKAAVHIGDYPRTDVAGAQGVGMRAVKFTGVYDWENGSVKADAQIASYGDLEPLLNNWEN